MVGWFEEGELRSDEGLNGNGVGWMGGYEI